VLGFGAFAFIVICYLLYRSEGRFLLQLQEPSVSRGLITFLVAFVTVTIALVLATWVIASNAPVAELKERFSHAKDVLATLVGILGTILGFYFGSADKAAPEPLAMAQLQFKSGQVITHVSGGTAPYRYTITAVDADAKGGSKVSKDGWIFDFPPTAIKSGDSVTVEAVDAKDHKVSKAAKMTDAEKGPPAAPATPPKPGSPPADQPGK
jgi:hypothetical protein